MRSDNEKPPSFLYSRTYLIILLFSLALSLLISARFPLTPGDYRAGDIAKETIRAPYDVTSAGGDQMVKKGEVIVREGQKIHEDDLTKLDTLKKARSQGPGSLHYLYLFLILFTSITVIHEFSRKDIKKYMLSDKDLVFGCGFTLFMVLLIKACLLVFERFAPDIGAQLFFVIPIIVFGMVVRIVLFSEATLVFSVILSVAVAFTVDNGITVFLYSLVGNLLAAFFSGRCENRATVLKAGLFAGLVMAFLAILTHRLAGLPLGDLPLKVGFILLGGVGSSFIALGILPVIEAVFDYTTDIKLLELANLEHPLLGEMMVRAPGTYHHSIIVGNLSRSAAESIGAHPILTRVASYYHDIGKLKMPRYFIENRPGTEDVHQNLSPSMSALIILSHVKEGVELAEKHRLGRKISEIIQQHHGTSLVTYFYSRAKEKEDPDLYSIEEKDFRYPGPTPQTKEAGIIMLADAVEAASRTLDDPTPKRIETLVQNIIENIFIDGQLDECELTLKDLHAIQKSFTSILIGIFHQRIEYPEGAANGGTHKKFPTVVEGGQKAAGKHNRRLAHLFKVAG